MSAEMIEAPMRAITVQQPWAWAIARGGKTIENRSRQHPWMSAVGERIAIHAGKTWDEDAAFDRRIITAAKAAGDLFVQEELDPACYDFGVIVATADLLGVHHSGSSRCRCSWNEWAQPDCWHLVLGDVQPLRDPVECRGNQGLWTAPPLPAPVDRDSAGSTDRGDRAETAKPAGEK